MYKYYLITLFFICSVISAQEDTKPISLDSLAARAQSAYQNKDYDTAIRAVYEILSYSVTQSDLNNLYYFLGDCYSAAGNADSALVYLEKSVRAGFADYHYIKNDPDLEILRRNYSARFESILGLARDIEKNDYLTKNPIVITEYDNYTGPTDISKYKWPDYNQPMMDSLREKYQLPRITKPADSEFSKIALLLDWVSHRWEHRGDTCANGNALSILEAAEKGYRFCCGSYASVLQACLVASGYPARFVGLMRQGGYQNGSGHGCVEFWSDQYQKWILLDAQNDAWWESGGTPLSAFEARRLFVDGKDGDMTFRGQRQEFDYGKMKPEWIVYFFHLFYYDNPKLNEDGADPGVELIDDKVTPELFAEGFPNTRAITNDYSEIYPLLNQTKISFRHINKNIPTDSLEISLSHTMPYFDRFLIRINNADWKESPAKFTWVVNKGENIIEAKAVNSGGIEGKTSKIVLRNNISLSR